MVYISSLKAAPAWLVFAKDQFNLVRIQDIDERNDILMESAFAGVDIAQHPNLYQPLDSQKASIQQHLLELSALPNFNTAESISAVLADHPEADTWLPLRAKNQDMVVLMHKDTAGVVAIVDLRPWD